MPVGFPATAGCTLRRTGFTLLQMSIVLVIIGLILGGVLVGQDLVNAAAISAQISQIQKYQQAVIFFHLYNLAQAGTTQRKTDPPKEDRLFR